MTRGIQTTEAGFEVKLERNENIHQVALPDGRLVWCMKGTSLDDIPHKTWVFSQVAADAVLDKVASGLTVSKIALEPGFPPAHVIRRWAILNKDFREAMDIAKRMRAEHYHDEAIATAEGTNKKAHVGINKLKVSTYQWAAEKGDPGKFGAVKTIVGDPDRPVNIVVDTGIRRDKTEENVIETNFKEILE